MALREYQTDLALNTIHQIRMASQSGLGETIAPRITSVGGLITLYGSENEPAGVTLANVATKMALIKDNLAIESFTSLPNYIVAVQKSGTSTELVLTSIDLEDAGTVIS